jgi:hypothetical protein
MCIGLFLKTDMEVGLVGIAIFKVKYQPLYAIPDKKGNVEQLLLLGGMDGLMVGLYGI